MCQVAVTSLACHLRGWCVCACRQACLGQSIGDLCAVMWLWCKLRRTPGMPKHAWRLNRICTSIDLNYHKRGSQLARSAGGGPHAQGALMHWVVNKDRRTQRKGNAQEGQGGFGLVPGSEAMSRKCAVRPVGKARLSDLARESIGVLCVFLLPLSVALGMLAVGQARCTNNTCFMTRFFAGLGPVP